MEEGETMKLEDKEGPEILRKAITLFSENIRHQGTMEIDQEDFHRSSTSKITEVPNNDNVQRG